MVILNMNCHNMFVNTKWSYLKMTVSEDLTIKCSTGSYLKMTVSEDYSAIQDVKDHERMYIGQVFSIRRVIKID